MNGQEVSARTSVLVHKGELYIGLRPERYVGTVGEGQTVQVITVDPGERSRGSVPVSTTVYLREFSASRRSGRTGCTGHKHEDTPVISQTVATDEAGRASLEFVPERAGFYRIAAEASDGETLSAARPPCG